MADNNTRKQYVITECSLPNVLSDLFDDTVLTQKAISEKSDLNYSTLSAYTNGRSFPTLRCLLYLLDALGKSLVVVDKNEVPKEVHGWWNEINQTATGLPWKYRCSECGCPQDYTHNYCPNCGAKMEGCGNV